MKVSGAKPKKVPSEGRDAKVLSGRTKLSDIRDAASMFGKQSQPEAKLSGLSFASEKEIAAAALKKKLKASKSDPDVTGYAETLARTLTHAVDTFGSRINANAWLNRPNRIFNNQSPLQILTQDPAAVEEELVRIDHGIFA